MWLRRRVHEEVWQLDLVEDQRATGARAEVTAFAGELLRHGTG
jgi:hypothetical protein